MNIKTYNKALAEQAKKGLNFAFARDSDPADEQIYFCNDTDYVKYRIVAKLNLLTLYFFAVDLKVVWNYCSEHLKNKYYKFFKIGLNNVNNSDALEIVVDNQALTPLMQNYAPKEQSGITTGRKKFDSLFEFLSKKLASIKRHFFASPIQMMLEAVYVNSTTKQARKLPNLVYNMKPGGSERVWLSFEKNQFTIYYGVSFDDRAEQQLCKIFFSQLVDARKHVHNPPSIAVNETQMPKFLIDAFPQEKTKKYSFANGIISFTLFGTLVKKPESMASYLAGFRNYVYYHIQAQKCYLHSRVLRRISAVHKDLTHIKIQPFATN